MRKILILFVFLLAASDHYGQFSFGPKIGYTTSKLSTDFDDIKESVKHNYQIGAFFRFGKKLYLQPEAYFATSGGTLEKSGAGTKQQVKMKNIGVPVLVGFKLINAKIINLRVMAGPAANFIIDKKIEFDDLYQDPLTAEDLKNIAWGFDVGAGVDVFFLTLDVRYEFGLNNLYIAPTGGDDQKISNNTFIVSLGFKLM